MLPSVKRRTVGPFIFLDHFGPMDVPPGGGMEVRPHPHIGLATVTYLFDGGIYHRDSLGYSQAIRPGDVNWMTAGSGIVHSERTEPEMRATGFRMHGVQTWVALPKTHEETAPAFEHVEAARLPAWTEGGAALRLIVGTYAGRTAPTTHFSPIFYVGVEMAAGAALPVTPDHEERAIYVAEGMIVVGESQFGVGDLAVLAPGQTVEMLAGPDGAKAMLLGGAPIDGPRQSGGTSSPRARSASRRPRRLAREALRHGGRGSRVHPAAGPVTRLVRWVTFNKSRRPLIRERIERRWPQIALDKLRAS